MKRSAKRVAVIGAGPSGLAAVKELLDEGHDPSCFEQAAGLGGVFRFDEQGGEIWESCRLTSSGLVTAFSDFPVSRERAGHMPAGEYVRYLEDYCAAFGVRDRLRFGARVESVRRDSDGCWRVAWRDPGGMREDCFDAVAVCSGVHQHPHRASLPGLDSFAGRVLHGADYRRPAQVAGKKVLVVGAGESGADVAAEIARHATETVLSLRRGVAVQSRRTLGHPRDYRTSRLVNCAADWIAQTRHPSDDHKRSVYRRFFFLFMMVDKVLQLSSHLLWEILPLVHGRDLQEIRSNLRTRRLTAELLSESGGTLHEQFGTKTDEFVREMVEGRCRRVPAIARFEGARVRFADGSAFDPDLVILCTGFETKMSFLDPTIAAGPRFLHTFHPDVGPTLAFIGFLRPSFGAIPPLAELQARWFAQVVSGTVALPDRCAMAASIEREERQRARIFRAVRGRLDYLVDHIPACDALAAQVGCKPPLRTIRAGGRRFRLRFFAGPFVAAQFRLVGPHAKPELARSVILDLPVTLPWLDRMNLRLRWALSKVLQRRFGREFAPKLELLTD